MAALVAAMCFYTSSLQAQEAGSDTVSRPVTSIFTLDMGRADVLDTYLTPVTYHGPNLRLGYEAIQACGFNPGKWVRDLEVGVDYGNVKNPTGVNQMHSLMVEGRWSLERRWRDVLTPGLQFTAGGMVQARGGAIYNGHNSNNICSVKVHMALGVAGTASYPLNLGRLPVTLNYRMTMPVIGACYSPEYDESYYEIYVGNHSGLVHPAWWGNRFDIDNLVAADLHLGHTTLRLGYRNHFTHTSIRNLTHRHQSHSLVLGISTTIQTLSPRQ